MNLQEMIHSKHHLTTEEILKVRDVSSLIRNNMMCGILYFGFFLVYRVRMRASTQGRATCRLWSRMKI